MNRGSLLPVHLLSAFLAAPAIASPVLAFTSGTQSTFATFTGSAGWYFSTNQAITVTALDTWVVGDGPTTPVTVRLYNSSLTILASATVGPSDPTSGSPTAFYSHAITPVNLAAGTTYYLAQDVSLVDVSVTGLVTNPAINYLGGLRSAGTVTPLTDGLGGVVAPAYFGPNFEIASVPEPGTLYSLGAGLSVVVFLCRRRRS
jgi:hypothetical protein